MKTTLIRSLMTGFALLLATAHTGHATTISDSPAYLSAGVPPLVMLDISKDQQLYKKAYNDYSDLNGDGQLETDYKHTIDYYGYFDPKKCYTYTSSRFEPTVVNTDKYCTSGTGWSGNFLNWVSMTRMDAVRKLLYGGLRSTDSATDTVLERAYLPTDAHAWAKYYNGSDIDKLTPFTSIATTAPAGTGNGSSSDYSANSSVTIGTGLFRFRSSTLSVCRGDQVKVAIDASNYMIGYVLTVSSGHCSGDFQLSVVTGGTTGAGSLTTGWAISNLSATGISFCNLTTGATSGVNQKSQTNTNAPLMRVANGNFALWAANERLQCLWQGETAGKTAPTGTALDTDSEYSSGATRINSNKYTISGLASSGFEPNETTHGLGSKNYTLRVKACVSAALIGTEKCRQYPDGNYKPIGLLQVYGETDLMRFGLMTGSYNKNISGGVLRKNVGVLTDEINLTTDGSFKTPPSTGNIIGTLNKMRIYGYNYGDGTYLSTGGDNCAWQLTNITEGSCRSWGNPMSEIFYESLRYFAGKTATSAYTYSGTTADSTLGLPLATWDTTLVNSSNYCAPLNTVVFNASVSTNDDDLRTQDLADINASGSTPEAKSNAVGAGEGINGTTRYVGKIVGPGATATDATPTGDTGYELCTAKTIPGLGQVSGICPEGPTLAGSYLLPGLAHHANTNHIRSDITVPVKVPPDTTSLKVKTYGVQLATNVPQIRIAVTGETTPRVIIQPAYRLVLAGGIGGGALVDMKIVTQTATATTATGTIYLNWEDSEQGGDYDQDVWGVLSYSLNTATNTITVTTKTIAESTIQKQGFGYIISGTTEDGPHFHSGIENFDFTDTQNISVSGGQTNASGGCSSCDLGDTASTATYTLGTTSASSLQDPLYYAAKWGGFTDSDGDGTPNLATEYDKKNNTTGASTSDGVPDNYFLVSNPLYLETAMTKAFLAILATSSASAVATNSTSLKTNSLLFQAKFDSKDWSGKVLAYTIDTAGVIGTTEEWDAGLRVNSQAAASRKIITLNPDDLKGMPFQWTNIDTLVSAAGIAQKAFLNMDGGGTADTKGEKRVNYLRGDQTYEGAASGDFRQRPYRLGDIVFSSPQYVGAPNDGHFESTYAAFRTTYLTRNPVLYVGANDGMLHGFNACYPASASATPPCVGADQGKELIAYVPGKVYSNLSKLIDQTYSHKFFVDGSPTVNDAYGKIGQCGATDCWRTVLVSGLNAGGQGVFALDVTDPTQFTDPDTNANKLLIWEFTNADDADLGYTYSKPIIARLSNGKWAAIFGNGYNSSSGTAALYVLYLDKTLGTAWTLGTNFFKIDTGCNTAATTCTPVAGGNGLSSVTGWDKDGDGNIDYVYGGDLQGNMWKFDLSSTTPASWKVAIGATAPYTPLFTAVDLVTPTANRQPITTPPAISAHPLSGMLVLFGTGKVLAPADISDPQLQTFYAVWDKGDGSTVSGRSQLLEQSITSETGTNRITSANAMNWRTATSIPPDYLGWYMDLVVAPPPSVSNMKGERHVGTPKLEGGAVLFNTYIPSTVACDFGGDGWLMAMNYATGGLLPYPAFDTDNNGSINALDSPTGGKKVGAALGGSTVIGGGGIPPMPPPPPPPCATPPCPPPPPPPPPTPPSVCGSGTSSFAASSTTEGDLNTTPLQLRGLCGRVTWRELIQN